MEITSLIVSENNVDLSLTITDATNVNALRLWNDKTYKDYTTVIDLTSKLTGSATENITITPLDINEQYLDGVYFVEASTDAVVSSNIIGVLTRFKECILDKILELSACDDCLKQNDMSLINAQSLLLGLEDAINIKFINEILSIKKTLDKYCGNICVTCTQSKTIATSSSLDNNILIVSVDGGEI